MDLEMHTSRQHYIKHLVCLLMGLLERRKLWNSNSRPLLISAWLVSAMERASIIYSTNLKRIAKAGWLELS